MDGWNSTILIIVLIIVFLVVWLILPQYLVWRTIPKVIRMFIKSGAVGENNARPAEAVGFKHKGLLERMMSNRDYKPMALQVLMKANVIRMTDDGRVYLSREELARTRWANIT